MKRFRPQLRNRRGAIALFTTLLFLALVGLAAVTIDLSRAWFQRNEMQTMADAAALAGAVQLIRTPANKAADSAAWIGNKNRVLGRGLTLTASPPDIVYGNWDRVNKQFINPNQAPDKADAIQVTVVDSTHFLIANRLRWSRYAVRVQAVAWSGAPVSQTECMKPWAMSQTILVDSINSWLNNPQRGVARDLTAADLQALRDMETAKSNKLNFKLFLGDPNSADQLNSGNYYAVNLPPLNKGGGGSAYEQQIVGVDKKTGKKLCESVTVGDTLITKPGGMVGPTNAGMAGSASGKQGPDGMCSDKFALPACKNDDGTPIDVKSAFWSQTTNKGNGTFYATVKVIGSFTLTGYYADDDKGTAVDEAGTIMGRFKPITEMGPVGTATTTLVRPLLVK
jgi:Flp pilus assembly protein TadG